MANMSKAQLNPETLLAQLNEQTDVIDSMREAFERICELEDDDEAGAAKVIAKQALDGVEFKDADEADEPEPGKDDDEDSA